MRRVFQLVALGAVLTFTAAADNIVLTFEGLPNADPVLNYFNGGQDGAATGPGPSDGVIFSASATAFISADDGGSGVFGGDPYGNTALTFLPGLGNSTMDVPGGFSTAFSFYYSAMSQPEMITIWSAVDDSGTILATLTLPVTGNGNALGNPTCPTSNDQFCPFFAIGVDFSGTAASVDFTQTEGQVAFDGFTLGSDVPLGTAEPGAFSMLGLGLASLLVASRRQRKFQ
jgi:hypothetical protein